MQVPLFHVFGSVVIMSAVFNHGGTIVLPCKGYDPMSSLETARLEK